MSTNALHVPIFEPIVTPKGVLTPYGIKAWQTLQAVAQVVQIAAGAPITGDGSLNAPLNIAVDGVTIDIAAAQLELVPLAASLLLGRGSAAGTGKVQPITLGTGLAMTGTTLSVSGSVGADGLPGLDGMPGPAGAGGAAGAAGAPGIDGLDGMMGAPGATGATGATGSTGAAGAVGPAGLDGLDGSTGMTGATGATGSTGATGAAGADGVMGLDGLDAGTPLPVLPRTTTVTSSATPSINTNVTDIFTITALATGMTSLTTNLTGNPVNGQRLIVRILDNASAQTLAWGASFVARGVSLPTTTVASKYLYVGFLYNSTAAVWDCVAVSQEV